MTYQAAPGLFYILDGHTPVAEPDPAAWAMWFAKTDRQVAKTQLPGNVEVSTVFMGVNHSLSGAGEPLLFETMVSGGPSDKYLARCSTWEQAEKQHQVIVELAAKV